jgi:hypothetical protein
MPPDFRIPYAVEVWIALRPGLARLRTFALCTPWDVSPTARHSRVPWRGFDW